jgi:hypothetical protein
MSGPEKAGFSAYLSHTLLRFGTRSYMHMRIVAPKVAGSSPVGHPLTQVCTHWISVFCESCQTPPGAWVNGGLGNARLLYCPPREAKRTAR